MTETTSLFCKRSMIGPFQQYILNDDCLFFPKIIFTIEVLVSLHPGPHQENVEAPRAFSVLHLLPPLYICPALDFYRNDHRNSHVGPSPRTLFYLLHLYGRMHRHRRQGAAVGHCLAFVSPGLLQTPIPSRWEVQ
jgi:hypothetical protein